MDGRADIELALGMGVTGFTEAVMEAFSVGEMAEAEAEGNEGNLVVSKGGITDADEEGWSGPIRGADGKRDN